MFAEEKPALLPLPLEPFRYYQYGERAVHLDGCVEVEAAYYSAPPGWIGRRVQVQWNARQVRLLDPNTGPTAARASCVRTAAGIASTMRIAPSGLRSAPCNCWRAPKGPASTSAAFCRDDVSPDKDSPPCAAFRACCRSPRSMARAASRMPALPRWNRSVRIPFRAPLSGAQSTTAAELAAGRSADPPAHAVSRPHRRTELKRTNQEPNP